MRVRYGDLRASEHRQLAALDARIDAFLSVVRERPHDTEVWQRAVKEVHSGLDAEPWDDGRVIVWARSRELAPIAERVVARAPAGCLIGARRPPRGLEGALEAVRRRCAVDLSRARFRAGFTRGHLLEVVLYVPGGSAGEREHVAAERLVWDVVGDQVADAWIGRVRVAPEPRGGPLRVVGSAAAEKELATRLRLDELGRTIETAVHGLLSSLPDIPAWARSTDGDWVLLEAEPESPDCYEAQDDLMIASTREPELLKCFLSGEPFSSARFSRHGELHFYLKFASHGPLEQRLDERSTLEDVLDRRLGAARAGRVTGGGLGLHHTYVNFVLSDCDLGFEIARAVGKTMNLPARSWILPFDDELAAEWLEIWPDAPAPPGFSL